MEGATHLRPCWPPIVCAVLCGARGYEAIAQWIHASERKLWYLLGYFRRPPTSGAFRYLLNEALAGRVGTGAAPVDRAGRRSASRRKAPAAVAIDGKTLCGTLGEHGRSLQLLSLFDQRPAACSANCEVPQDTNEAKAALPILRTLVLAGRVVTADAMFCQSEICREIVDCGRRLSDRRQGQPARTERYDCRRFLAGIFPPRRGVSASDPSPRPATTRKRTRPPDASDDWRRARASCRSYLRSGRGSLKCCDWNARPSGAATSRVKSSTPSPVFRPIGQMRRSCSLCGEAIGASKIATIGFVIRTGRKTVAGSVSRRGAHNLAAFRNAAINLLRLANTTNLAAALRENAYRVEHSSLGSV